MNDANIEHKLTNLDKKLAVMIKDQRQNKPGVTSPVISKPVHKSLENPYKNTPEIVNDYGRSSPLDIAKREVASGNKSVRNH